MGQSTYKNRNGVRENRSTSLIAAVGIKLQKEWMQTEEGRHQQRATVAILDIGGMHHRVKHETRGIDDYMPLLAVDFLPRIIAMRIDAAPPFSAPFTLWLSITAAVGLASRSTCSRHFM